MYQRISVLIPIKKNSERIPGKNKRLFNGRPLYRVVPEMLSRSEYVSEILVNTDCDEIARSISSISSKCKTINRPETLQGEHVIMNSLIRHDMEHCSNEHILQTHCTNPLLCLNTVNKAIEIYFKNLDRYDTLFSVTEIRSRVYRKNTASVNHNKSIMERTQDMEALFEENSNLFLFSKTSFVKSGNNRIGIAPQQFIMNRIEGIDIDYEDDFLLAELVERNKDTFSRLFYPEK